jgi:hypothetical protein
VGEEEFRLQYTGAGGIWEFVYIPPRPFLFGLFAVILSCW